MRVYLSSLFYAVLSKSEVTEKKMEEGNTRERGRKRERKGKKRRRNKTLLFPDSHSLLSKMTTIAILSPTGPFCGSRFRDSTIWSVKKNGRLLDSIRKLCTQEISGRILFFSRMVVGVGRGVGMGENSRYRGERKKSKLGNTTREESRVEANELHTTCRLW